MNAIVTGANGFVGSSLVEKLTKKGIKVLAIDVAFSNQYLLNNELVNCQILNLNDVENCVKSIPFNSFDIFYNFAWRGVNGFEKTKYDVQINNIMLALKCAEIAKAVGCKKYLCAGTIAESSIESLFSIDTVSGGMMYGMAKYSAHILLETYCKNIGLDFVWMQFSNIYGPNNKTGNLISYTIGQLSMGEVATFGQANQPYDFIFIDDLLEAVYRLGVKQTNKHKYFIGSGEPRILKDYLFEVGRAFGKEELIQIGKRKDDGIKYSFDMFKTDDLINEIGYFVTKPFSEWIRYTIDNY